MEAGLRRLRLLLLEADLRALLLLSNAGVLPTGVGWLPLPLPGWTVAAVRRATGTLAMIMKRCSQIGPDLHADRERQ